MWRKTQTPDAVARVRAAAEQASGLSAVQDQALNDPRTNPAVRGEYDRLRDAQQRDELAQAHRRALRRGRVSDRRAAEAEKALEALAAARETTSAARAVVALHQGRRKFLAGALVASIALSAGSALGMAAIAVFTGGPAAAGWIAELCLTVTTTAAILYRSHVDQASTRQDADRPTWQGWRGRVLWGLVAVPLATSVAANLVGWAAGAAVSPINALCAVGAGIAGVFAYLVADVSSRAIKANADAVKDTDEDRLRATAMGDVFTQEPAAVRQDAPVDVVADPAVAGPRAVSAELVDLPDADLAVAVEAALEDPRTAEVVLEVLADRGLQDTPVPDDPRELTERPDEGDGPGGVGTPPPAAPSGGPSGAARQASAAEGAPGAARGAHGDAQQVPTPSAEGGAEGGQAAQEGPLEATPAAVRAYRRAYPHESLSAVARAFRISRRTVRRYLDTPGGEGS